MSDQTDDVFDVNLDDAVTPELLPDGTECQFVIVEAKATPEKHMVLVRTNLINAPGEFVKNPLIKLFYPKAEDSPEKRNNKLLRLNTFAKAVQADLTPRGGIDLNTLVGKTGWAIWGVENDEKYGASNDVRSYIAPK